VVYGSMSEAEAAGEDVLAPGFVLGFKYYAPNVSHVTVPSGGLSTLGGFVTLEGSDLGLPGNLRALLVRSVTYGSSSSKRKLSLATSADGEVTVVESAVGHEQQRWLAAASDDENAFDASEWVELDYDVHVVNSTHDYARISIGEGEGMNQLLVNVSGQVSLTPLAYAAPVLTYVTPESSPTQGGLNVTLIGENFGVAGSFVLALSGAGEHCNHAYTEADLGVSVFAYSHTRLWFFTPEGQCDGAMALTLEVAGQVSNALTFWYDPPEITMLSLDGKTPLGSDCSPSSTKGCKLDTTGGYTVTVTGTNFGVAEQTVSGISVRVCVFIRV
jgi:hypothetical protein